ncbi:hypothetical protein CONLIGDRAFT_243212 [Coniochaeta ligniaria NRRL 30616]|uniref:Uncharacterized protein n=1 Tax=Coniochaeta ligniaria NRRL 30616 TaxID=1408157 RepID=A0A1J7IX17_9PEZI|nr:hypothetical protein CONLIGDRAFT_243212 [Coniochaeta ligniaria NRRL 30616]
MPALPTASVPGLTFYHLERVPCPCFVFIHGQIRLSAAGLTRRRADSASICPWLTVAASGTIFLWTDEEHTTFCGIRGWFCTPLLQLQGREIRGRTSGPGCPSSITWLVTRLPVPVLRVILEGLAWQPLSTDAWDAIKRNSGPMVHRQTLYSPVSRMQELQPSSHPISLSMLA